MPMLMRCTLQPAYVDNAKHFCLHNQNKSYNTIIINNIKFLISHEKDNWLYLFNGFNFNIFNLSYLVEN